MKKRRQKNKIWASIKTLFFFLAVGVLLVYVFVEAFMPNQTVKIFMFKPYIVITQSMEPVINVDDMVIVKNPNIDALEVGDIITFEADINFSGQNEVVTHYIYSISEDGSGVLSFQTHRYYDDPADYSPDSWVLSEDDILGEYVVTIPRVGFLIRFLQSPFGIAALVVNVGVIVVVVVLLKQGKEAQPQENDEEDRE